MNYVIDLTNIIRNQTKLGDVTAGELLRVSNIRAVSVVEIIIGHEYWFIYRHGVMPREKGVILWVMKHTKSPRSSIMSHLRK
jgi:hypothetical protein